MIVDPDMPDHWKVRMLCDLIGDDLGPVYLIRIWGHCQSRKKDRFDNLPPAAIKAICRYAGEAEKLDNALAECGFIERSGKSVYVVGWSEHNSNLWTAWENGKKGGRPKKPTENPSDNPGGNPKETTQKPGENPNPENRNHSKSDEGDEGDEGEGKKGGEGAPNGASARKKPKPDKNGCRIPDDFPTDDDLIWATQEFPGVDHNQEAAKFRDYWKGIPGQKGRKLDWPATWRNWIRRAAESSKGKTPETDKMLRGAV